MHLQKKCLTIHTVQLSSRYERKYQNRKPTHLLWSVTYLLSSKSQKETSFFFFPSSKILCLKPCFFTQPTELVSVKTLCKDSGFYTTDSNRDALGKDHDPVQFLLELQNIWLQRKQCSTSSSNTQQMCLGTWLTSIRRIWLVTSRDVALMAGSLRSSSWLGYSHQYLMTFAAIAQDSVQGWILYPWEELLEEQIGSRDFVVTGDDGFPKRR